MLSGTSFELVRAYQSPTKNAFQVPIENAVLAVSESPHPVRSVLSFLLVTLHVSFYLREPMLEKVSALLKGKKGLIFIMMRRCPYCGARKDY